MPRSNRPWLPATPGQSAVVLTLVVLLMLNTTVLMLLVSGDLSSSHVGERQTADAGPPRLAMADAQPAPDPAPARAPSVVSGAPVTRPPATIATAAEPAPQTTTPAPSIRVATETESHEPAVSAEPIAPVQDEPPLQFFGLDLN